LEGAPISREGHPPLLWIQVGVGLFIGLAFSVLSGIEITGFEEWSWVLAIVFLFVVNHEFLAHGFQSGFKNFRPTALGGHGIGLFVSESYGLLDHGLVITLSFLPLMGFLFLGFFAFGVPVGIGFFALGGMVLGLLAPWQRWARALGFEIPRSDMDMALDQRIADQIIGVLRETALDLEIETILGQAAKRIHEPGFVEALRGRLRSHGVDLFQGDLFDRILKVVHGTKLNLVNSAADLFVFDNSMGGKWSQVAEKIKPGKNTIVIAENAELLKEIEDHSSNPVISIPDKTEKARPINNPTPT